MAVEINLLQIADYFYRANATLKIDKKYLLNEVALIAKDDVQKRIKIGKKDPDGVAWAAWKPSTLKSRTIRGTASTGLLFETGGLLNSITSKVTANEAEIFTRKSYASTLEDGTRHMSPWHLTTWWIYSLTALHHWPSKGDRSL